MCIQFDCVSLMDTPSILHWREVILFFLACVIVSAIRIRTSQYIVNMSDDDDDEQQDREFYVRAYMYRMCAFLKRIFDSRFNKCANCISGMISRKTNNKLYCNYSILFVRFDNSKCYCISFIVWRCWFMTRTQITWFVFHHHHQHFRSVSFACLRVAWCCAMRFASLTSNTSI